MQKKKLLKLHLESKNKLDKDIQTKKMLWKKKLKMKF
jgi:hypothetical protein